MRNQQNGVPKSNRETASSASRHTVGKRTHDNKNEMGKQSTRSKTKRNLMAQEDQGNTLQANEISYSLNADTNPDGTNIEITQHLDAASTQPDTAVTSQGANVGDPSMTLPGMEGEAEGKRDTLNDQVVDEVMIDQQTSPADSCSNSFSSDHWYASDYHAKCTSNCRPNHDGC